MIIRYEYNSTCCNHLYMETRLTEQEQIHTKCNVCSQGEYVLINEVVLEDLSAPVLVEQELPNPEHTDISEGES